jgi:hypothetical protein
MRMLLYSDRTWTTSLACLAKLHEVLQAVASGNGVRDVGNCLELLEAASQSVSGAKVAISVHRDIFGWGTPRFMLGYTSCSRRVCDMA